MSNEKEQSDKPESIPTIHVQVGKIKVFVVGTDSIDRAILTLLDAINELERIKVERCG